jgi:3'(2'), 5'-bisphosphate nucleotidase
MTEMSAGLTDTDLAAHLAEVAGRILLEVRSSGVFSGKSLGKAGDQTANQFLVHALREQRPDDGLLSEEEKDNFERLAHSRVWIVDPVDGTREYGEERTDWAVHVALAVDGVPLHGAVALPGLGVVLLPMGSAGAKAMAVVRGEADIYLHTGGQFEWDSCAPVAVAQAHGLHCSRVDGSPLVYNQSDTYMPDLLICRPEQAARVLELVGALSPAAD